MPGGKLRGQHYDTNGMFIELWPEELRRPKVKLQLATRPGSPRRDARQSGLSFTLVRWQWRWPASEHVVSNADPRLPASVHGINTGLNS